MLETIGKSLLPVQSSASGNSNDSSASALSAASKQQTLGQADFLTLMTAQMKNQDPMKPMENGDFLAQMAQFSTVAGIDRVNDTLTAQSGDNRDARMATATNLLGHQVLVPGNLARPDESGTVYGVVDLPDDADSVLVSYSDPATGEILGSENLGAQPAGLVGFNWSDLPPEYAANRSPVRVSVTAVSETGTLEIGPSVYARVVSARSGGYGSEDITLQVEDYGALNALEVEAFR
jgi:flagellar basal-body rod modification protein FlgD